MAIVEDASAPAAATNSTTTVTTAPFTPVAGSLLVAVACGGGGTAVQTVPVTDSLGSTWTLLKRANTNNFAGETEIWVMDAGPSPASRTVTATITGSDGIGVALCVKVLTGAKPAATCLGGFTVVNSTTAYTISITTTTAGSLACAGLVDSTASGALTGPNGITTAWQSVSDTGAGHKYAQFRATSLTGTPGATVIGFTNTAANNQAIVAVEILAATAASSSAFVPRLGSRIAGTGPIPGGFMVPMRIADKISYVWPAAAAAQTASGAADAGGRVATTATGGKGAVSTANTGQRSSDVTTTIKQAAAPAASAQRDTTVDNTTKNATNTGLAPTRATTADTTRKQSAAASIATGHAITQGQGGLFVGPNGPANAPTRSATSTTGKRGTANAALAIIRPAAADTAKRATTGAASAATRPQTTPAAVRRAQAPALAGTRIHTRAQFSAAFIPAYVGVDGTTTSTGALGGTTRGNNLDGNTTAGGLDGTAATIGTLDGNTTRTGMIDT
jgi:hypothetical protein